jgi:hypothetical protein
MELAELAPDARAVAAGDDAEIKFLGEEPDDAARAREQRRVFQFVGAGPEAVGFDPLGAWESSGAINPQPVGGLVLRELALGPPDAQRSKHGEIGAQVGLVGIQECAIPVEEDGARGKLCDFHGARIVTDRDAGLNLPREWLARGRFLQSLSGATGKRMTSSGANSVRPSRRMQAP